MHCCCKLRHIISLIFIYFCIAYKFNFLSIRIYVSNKSFKLDVHRGRSGPRVKISVKQCFITKEREYFLWVTWLPCKHEIARICRNDAAPEEETTTDKSATEETKGYLTFSACYVNKCIGKTIVYAIMVLKFFDALFSKSKEKVIVFTFEITFKFWQKSSW